MEKNLLDQSKGNSPEKAQQKSLEEACLQSSEFEKEHAKVGDAWGGPEEVNGKDKIFYGLHEGVREGNFISDENGPVKYVTVLHSESDPVSVEDCEMTDNFGDDAEVKPAWFEVTFFYLKDGALTSLHHEGDVKDLTNDDKRNSLSNDEEMKRIFEKEIQ
jgi:hypothetical protein